MTTELGNTPAEPFAAASATYLGDSTYTPFFLRRVYDPLVIRFANRFAWGCPSTTILRMYARHLSPVHLEVGPGTGWFVDHADPPAPTRITLLDPNRAVLDESSRRLARYPLVEVEADVLRSMPAELVAEPVRSVGMTHVLHCLPGSFETKMSALDHVCEVLAPGGTLFGSTILGPSAPHSRFSRGYLDYMNESGVFANLDDTEVGLRDALAARFSSSHVHRLGVTALFVARR